MKRDDSATVCRILRVLRRILPSHVSVSAKVRLASDEGVEVKRWHALAGTGVNFVTVHGRTFHENKTAVRAVRLRLALQGFNKIMAFRS